MVIHSTQTLGAVKAKSETFLKTASSIDWVGSIPFMGLHLGCFLVIATGWSPVALVVALAAYIVRGFCITAGYHRYFSHRSYKTGRFFQFLLALGATTAVQMGPLWWVSHHRNHHRYSDKDEDIHSPVTQRLWWSHIGWIMSASSYRKVEQGIVSDLARYPELRWLDRWCLVPPMVLAVLLWGAGSILEIVTPAWGTTGLQMLAWGFFISTVALHHATFCVNSVAHVFGSRRFDTHDQSRNNAFVALVALGEGWHNNHHRFPTSVRQGIAWWEVDMTHGILKVLAWFGVVHSLRTTSQAMVDGALLQQKAVSLNPNNSVFKG